jgi:Predicted nucleotide-binding protein containing TIR-like domain
MRRAAPKSYVCATSRLAPTHVPALSALPGVLEWSKVAFGSRHPGNLGLVTGRRIAMGETFGYRLKQFALAKDIVDKDTFKEIFELVRRYVSRDLAFTYWALLVDAEVDGKPGIRAFECSTGNRPSFSLRTADGLYAGLAPHAFDNARKLWVVSRDKQPLGPDQPIMDLWSNTDPKDLAACLQSRGANIKTVILAPLCSKGRKIGVLDLQMDQYYEPTNIAKEELELLAETLSELLLLSEINEMRRECTGQALDMLRTVLEKESWPPLTKPQIFVASSSRADREVMGKVMSVLNTFADRLRIYNWAQSAESGNINWDVLKQVKASRFGLCYFSEPTSDSSGKFKYQDNPNVVFEAGMFQSLTNPAATDAPTGWIPIREPHTLCPPPPFDFAQQRMIIVERLEDNRPNLDKLQADLKNRIDVLL